MFCAYQNEEATQEASHAFLAYLVKFCTQYSRRRPTKEAKNGEIFQIPKFINLYFAGRPCLDSDSSADAMTSRDFRFLRRKNHRCALSTIQFLFSPSQISSVKRRGGCRRPISTLKCKTSQSCLNGMGDGGRVGKLVGGGGGGVPPQRRESRPHTD